MQNEPEIPDPPEPKDEVFGEINLLTRSLRDLDVRGLVLSQCVYWSQPRLASFDA